MASDLEEAVARAVHEAGVGVPEGDWDETKQQGENHFEVREARLIARAAIRATLEGIMEPRAPAIFSGMEAAHEVLKASAEPSSYNEAVAVWQAMIRHILEEQK